MNRTAHKLIAIAVGLLMLVLWQNGTMSVDAAPQNAKQKKNGRSGKSPSPAKSRHYVKQSFTAKDGTEIDYWIMSPAKIDKDRQYPLVLALHGRGGSTMAAKELGSNALREQYPCFVMAPASTSSGHWARPAGLAKRRKKGKNTKSMLPAALEAMDAVIKKHPINSSRVYVTGQSMGGTGTFGAMFLRPKAFAAAIRVCGGWDPQAAGKMKNIAIWVFHGETDKVVPTKYSRSMVEALTKAGGSPKYTEYPGVGHNSWSKTYASPETWKWLFDQARSNRNDATPQTNPEP